ncbi:hypothetical protein ACRAWD_01635 [Caulobacter segnis]
MRLADAFAEAVGRGWRAGLDVGTLETGHAGNFAAELFAGQGLLGGMFGLVHPAFDGLPTARTARSDLRLGQRGDPGGGGRDRGQALRPGLRRGRDRADAQRPWSEGGREPGQRRLDRPRIPGRPLPMAARLFRISPTNMIGVMA